jgi:phage tail sheath protein FI
VWKAPANVGVADAIGPTIAIDGVAQDTLNVDSISGKSVNAIRAFTGIGTLVWGARTLAGNDNEWRYVNVRRFCLFAEESVRRATRQFVFEPNDANTWVAVKAMIENFLTSLWRQGALMGAKAADAFSVQVGLGSTMTAIDVLEGRMVVVVGLCPVRPAEVIVLRFVQTMPVS